jgi:hypothetical protein
MDRLRLALVSAISLFIAALLQLPWLAPAPVSGPRCSPAAPDRAQARAVAPAGQGSSAATLVSSPAYASGSRVPVSCTLVVLTGSANRSGTCEFAGHAAE